MIESKGQCFLCHQNIKKEDVERHFEKCSFEVSDEKCLFLQIESRQKKQYWIVVAVAEDASLIDLDAFLRAFWVECCDHESEFEIDGVRYLSDDSKVNNTEKKTMDLKLLDLIQNNKPFKYRFDQKNKTRLWLKVIDKKNYKLDQPVKLVAQNEAPVFFCQCGQKAVWVCRLCQQHRFVCDDCFSSHECGDADMMFIGNSPRLGICQYSKEDEPYEKKCSVENIGVPQRYRYKLPKGFVLKHDFIYFSFPFSGNGERLPLENIDQFNQYKNDDETFVDCRWLMKKYLNLKKLPLGYYFSLVVYRVFSQEDLETWYRAHPDRDFSSDEEIEYDDYHLLPLEYHSMKWNRDIQDSLDKYFSAEKYEKPETILLKYGRCGCYDEKTGIDKNDWGTLHWPWFKKNTDDSEDWWRHLPNFQHSPMKDEDYHQVIFQMPLKFEYQVPARSLFQKCGSRVNTFAQDSIFFWDEYCYIWDIFTDIYLMHQLGQLDKGFIKEKFNNHIEFLTDGVSPVSDFFLRHYVDCLAWLESLKILKRCRHTNKAFDYHPTKLYLSNKEAKSARNARSYRVNQSNRRSESRQSMKDLREFYKNYGIKK